MNAKPLTAAEMLTRTRNASEAKRKSDRAQADARRLALIGIADQIARLEEASADSLTLRELSKIYDDLRTEWYR